MNDQGERPGGPTGPTGSSEPFSPRKYMAFEYSNLHYVFNKELYKIKKTQHTQRKKVLSRQTKEFSVEY